MSDEATQLREAIRKIRTEVDCRISHGAESFGHLEYVKEQLDKALAIQVRGCQSGTHEHPQTSTSPELKERINSAIVDPNSIAEEIGEAPCGIGHLRYVEAEFVESLAEELNGKLKEAVKARDHNRVCVKRLVLERDSLRHKLRASEASVRAALEQIAVSQRREDKSLPTVEEVRDRIAKMNSMLEAANLCAAHVGLKQEQCPACSAALAATHVDLLQKNCHQLAEENRRLREAFQMAATHLPLGSEASRLAQEALSLGISVEPSEDK